LGPVFYARIVNAKIRFVAVLAALAVLIATLGWLLVVLPAMDVFLVSVAVAVSWCVWLERRPPQSHSK